MPVKNGAIPDAPEGGHSSQAGTLLELAAVLGAEPSACTPGFRFCGTTFADIRASPGTGDASEAGALVANIRLATVADWQIEFLCD